MTATTDTGFGATFLGDTLAIAGVVEEMGELDQAGGKLEDTALATGPQKSFAPDDSWDGGEIEITLQVSRESSLPEIHAVDTFTQTYPLEEGETSPASWTASGIVLKRKLTKMKRGERQLMTLTIALDGKETPFSWTPAVDT